MSWKIAGVSLVGNLILGWLILQAHQDIGAAVAECNADKLSQVAQAENAVRVELQRTHIEELARRDQQLQVQASAREAAEQERLQALQGVETRDTRIRQLELEASIDDIPDSNECLNVYVPSDVVERMFTDQSCDQARNSNGDGSPVCTDSRGVLDDNFPDFATITFGDVARGWNHDRHTLRQCNIDKRAIKSIEAGMLIHNE